MLENKDNVIEQPMNKSEQQKLDGISLYRLTGYILKRFYRKVRG